MSAKKYKFELKPIDLTVIGETVKTLIVNRTHSGFDKNMRPFKPYTEKYKKWKRKKTGMTSVVNLELTGRMLDNIAYEKKGKSKIRFGFVGMHDSRSSNAEVALGNYKNGRKFLALDRENAKFLKKILQKQLKNAIILKKT